MSLYAGTDPRFIGASLFNVRQTGLGHPRAVQEKLAQRAGCREGINAHLTAPIACATRSPADLLMPDQSLLMTGRVLASAQLRRMMPITQELCGGQIGVAPDTAAFASTYTTHWLEKYDSVDENRQTEDHRKPLAFARDLPNADDAGHRLSFRLFAQSPPYADLAALDRHFDWAGTLRVVHQSAGRSGRARPVDPTLGKAAG